MTFSPFIHFNREEWAALGADAPVTLSEEDLAALRSLYERLSPAEAAEVHQPLSRLLHLYVKATENFKRERDSFLSRPAMRSPFVIAIAGSVAVGKSTFARVLQATLAGWPDRPAVELVTTDGFLYPNAVLEEQGLMKRKGFPESYDLRRFIDFLAAVKAGEDGIAAPVYSHLTYDIVGDAQQAIGRPDILICEGLNVLQARHGAAVIASDFFDFSVYIDAEEEYIEQWFIERFLKLQRTAFQEPLSYFRRYKNLPEAEARQFASGIWREINLVNLRENIQPTRQRADLVLRKQPDHSLKEVWLRQM
jgi:type I pantothenate kinase